jgi:hypothetical protein
MPPNNFIKTTLQDFDVQPTGEAESRRDVISWAARFELVEKP